MERLNCYRMRLVLVVVVFYSIFFFPTLYAGQVSGNWNSQYIDTNDLSGDIAPAAKRDGKVDEQDLELLMQYWDTEIPEIGLIAHWKLDEVEGDTAYDSAGTNDAIVLGDPVWQPEGGMVDGAIALDGVDDYLEAPFVLNPADGAFSVLAWIKGGAQNQIVLSQEHGANCLGIDSAEGCLMTELEGAGRISGGTLLSGVNITDGTWHKIALVWDGSYRCLYVDGAEVARDGVRLSSLKGVHGGLYFGVGSTLAPGTFFSGLIDDIRIYNRAVRP